MSDATPPLPPGATFAFLWDMQEANLVALGIGDALRFEMRRAFYSGTAALVAAMQAANGHAPAIKAVIDEVQAFARANLHEESAATPPSGLAPPDPIVLAIAEICHGVNRVICEAAGDRSQASWEDAESWQRQSALKGVLFALDNPGASASAQHDAWMADKLSDGWTYGDTKDAAAKTHPCIVPYDALPFEQRVKDHVFRALVTLLSERASP